MDERQRGYPECEGGQSTILYPCPGTIVLASDVNAPYKGPTLPSLLRKLCF